MRKIYQRSDYFGYGAAGYSNYGGQGPALRKTFGRLLAQLDRQGVSGGKLLEIGCGPGYLLEEAQHHFDRLVGTELSGAVHYARERADQVYRGGIDVVPDGDCFDCIVATHVIEHVYRPRLFVTKLLEHLRPGGALVLVTPDMGSLWRRAMGRFWPSFKFPEHVVLYDAIHLRAVLGDAGLVAIQQLPLVEEFCVSDILMKLRLPVPGFTRRLTLPIPGVSICMLARRTSGVTT